MAKPEWGTKRQCSSCGARFYDLMKPEIACPKCGTVYDPDAATKSRRSRPAAEKPVERQAVVEEVEAPAEAEAAAEGEEAEEEDEALIEDASDLGEDEDDMAEVIENVEDQEER
ncbi:MAG: TIGR02300 family protein [Alphaproteobacteria bacterium]|nr:TIGR02300 family protein [Alphaproteobacteria bacterium]